MGSLYISEYEGLAHLGGGRLPAMSEPSLATHVVAIGGASAQSPAFSTGTHLVRVHADANCSLKFGQNPTASTTDLRTSAGFTEYFAVNPGDKVAVIANA